MLGATLVVFVAFFNVYQGMKDINPIVLANARVLGAGGGKMLRHVYLPAAATWITSSLRASVGFAVVGAIIAKYLGASAGLGYVIASAEGSLDATGVFAGITVLAAFVLLLDGALTTAERRLFAWNVR